MRWPGVLAVAGAIAGCIDKSNSGPYDALPLDGVFRGSVSAPVHVARDRDGVAHIDARSLEDAAFVQGFVMAHDRLPQMDVLRRTAAGTLAELYGAIDPRVIDGDLAMRVHRLAPLAAQAWATLQASTAPEDQQLVALVERFAAGVNAYALALAHGTWTLDPAVADRVDPSRFAAWTPVDSLMIARLYLLASAWTVPYELEATELYQKARAAFDLATGAPGSTRRGIARDLLRFTPLGREPAVATTQTTRAAPAPGAPRPAVPQELLDAARGGLVGPDRAGPLEALGRQAMFSSVPRSTAWAVTPALTGDGRALLAGEVQLALTSPSMLYPTHLIVAHLDEADRTRDAPLDLIGATLPGVPGVLYGMNGHVAWVAAPSGHDVNDVYLEQISPCGDRACAAWTDPQGVARQVPIASFSEDVKIGALGEIQRNLIATYERVPHHGPIAPVIDRDQHTLVQRTGGAALSFRATGDEPTFELRALYQLALASSTQDAERALGALSYGNLGFVVIDDGGRVAWSSRAELPRRADAAYTWDPRARPDGLAPFFVLPGDGSAEWRSQDAPAGLVPRVVDPAQGFVVTGGADPVGATFDGLPLNQAEVDGAPSYAGAAYGDGLREAQIAGELRAIATSRGVTLDDLARLTADTRSAIGAQLAPVVLAALGALDGAPGSRPADVAPYVAGLPAADRARLTVARGLLAGWTLDAPAALAADDPGGADAAATAVFHTWLRSFTARALADELDAIGVDVWRLEDSRVARVVAAMLLDPASFVMSPATAQPILCAQLGSPGADDSCTKVVLQAMVDAMQELESPRGFGTADPAAWRWGRLHQLALAPLVPAPELGVPAPEELAGVAVAGDRFAPDPGGPGSRALVPRRAAAAPALRLIAEAVPGSGVAMRWAIPGGAVFDRRSTHFRDQLDRAGRPDALRPAAYTRAEIIAAGEARWVFR